LRKKVLLFADFGIDDIFAYMYGALHDNIEIIGVVASYGNVSREHSFRNANLLKKITRSTSVPVILGAASPLTGDELKTYPEVHGPQGLGPFTLPKSTSDSIVTFEKIYELILNNDDVIIVNIGRLTSLAISLINNQAVLGRVKEILIMGGAFQAQGNITPVAEANVYSDYIAANIVNKLAKRIKYFPLDVTLMAVISEKHVEVLSRNYPKKIRTFLMATHHYYTKFYESKGFVQCSPLHDLLPMWALVNEEYISFEKKCIEIIMSSSARGQSIGYQEEGSHCVVHHIATSFRYDSFINDVITTFHQGSMKVIEPDLL
jgi:purine nucleosidase